MQMMLQKTVKIINNADGFSLLEALVSVVLLGLLAITVATVYSAGNKSLAVQTERMMLDSKLRSRMEYLMGTDFSALGDGSESVTINGNSYQIVWSVVPIDLDGDTNPEDTARQVTVSVSGLADAFLTTIRVDKQGAVGKIS